jgi:hypothetical protein
MKRMKIKRDIKKCDCGIFHTNHSFKATPLHGGNNQALYFTYFWEVP